MEITNKILDRKQLMQERDQVLNSWPTGADVNLKEAIVYQGNIPESKRFSAALARADKDQKTLLQPRAGVALLSEQITLLQHLQPGGTKSYSKSTELHSQKRVLIRQ